MGSKEFIVYNAAKYYPDASFHDDYIDAEARYNELIERAKEDEEYVDLDDITLAKVIRNGSDERDPVKTEKIETGVEGLSFGVMTIGMILAIIVGVFLIPIISENVIDTLHTPYHPYGITILNKTDTIIRSFNAEDRYIIETDLGEFEANPEVYHRLQENKQYVVNVWGTFIFDIINEVNEDV